MNEKRVGSVGKTAAVERAGTADLPARNRDARGGALAGNPCVGHASGDVDRELRIGQSR